MRTTLRPAAPADRSFLLAAYAHSRADVLAMADWDAATFASFMQLQFDAQERGYRSRFPASVCSVIECGGQPIGRLWVDHGAEAIHLLDITVLASHRRRGLGTECLLRLMDQARAAGLPLSLQVLHANPARRLYARLGFVAEAEHGLYTAMAWRAGHPVPMQEIVHEQA
ncbi:GNAT family N-acetyltransferase [Ideonella sp. A 288]|uniref:GNAT family N-acetyltransferase n=1 Tax=Ideonella sp. A 288 TaxID=1962181 RepID=UPI000B4AA4A7|nr:GNAT family N-acetyltransferase [Ideonella sp. A 288]